MENVLDEHNDLVSRLQLKERVVTLWSWLALELKLRDFNPLITSN